MVNAWYCAPFVSTLQEAIASHGVLQAERPWLADAHQ
jgi:hypothetical protein